MPVAYPMLPYIGPTLHCPTSDLSHPWFQPYAALCQTYPMSPYIRPILCHPTLDLPYTALHWTYPTPPYIGPTLCCPTLRQTYPMVPYTRPVLHWWPTLHHPTPTQLQVPCPSASYLWLQPPLHLCWTLRCMRGSFLGQFLTDKLT